MRRTYTPEPDGHANCDGGGRVAQAFRPATAAAPRHKIMSVMLKETAFEMAVSNIRFGAGVTREVGSDLKDLGVRTALVFADPKLRSIRPVNVVQTVLESLDEHGVTAVLYHPIPLEPSDAAF